MEFLSDHSSRGLAPIAHDVEWYYIALAILVGAAMLEHGASMVARGWEKELGLPNWASVVGESVGIVLATALGCLVGHLVWSWALGATVALVGALSSKLVVSLVRAKFINATKKSARDAVEE